jgi:virulence-associated protein VagC
MAVRKKTKLFMSGNNQTEKIPCEFQVQTWPSLTHSLAMFTDDFMEEGRQQPPLQKQKSSFACR